MKVVTLASGSKGNCTLIQTEQTRVLIDAGINLGEIEEKLKLLGVSPNSIDAILITHEHSDHIKNVGSFSKKYDCDVYAHINEWNTLNEKIKNIGVLKRKAFKDKTFYIKDLTINWFELSHDANMCVGYSFYNQNVKVSIATDLGYCPEEVMNNLKDSNLLILEANHDEKLLLNNPRYSSLLKKRILSKKGHLSNYACANVLINIYSSRLKQVILGHLSEENNSPDLAFSVVKNEIAKAGIIEGKHIFIDVASQHNIGHIFDITN